MGEAQRIRLDSHTTSFKADGIENWQELTARIRQAPHVTAVSPVLYSGTYFAGPLQAKGGVLKGVDVDRELALSTTLRHLKLVSP